MFKLNQPFKTLAAVAGLAASTMGSMAMADVQERTLKFGHLSTADSVNGQGVYKFADLVNERSDGKITVQVFDSGQLGNEVQQIGALQAGLQEFVLLSSSPLASMVPHLQVLDFPVLMTSRQEAFGLLDGPIGQGMLDEFTSKGLVGLSYWENGFRQFTNNKKPIEKVEDFDGLKVRVIQNPIYIDMFDQLGTAPVPMPFTELYTALETHMVDGQDNPVATNKMARFAEVQEYMTITRHIYNPMILIGSNKMWDSFSAKEKEIVQSSATDAATFQRQLAEDMEQQQIEEMKADGMKVNVLSDEEVAKMTTRLKPVIEKYTSTVGEEFVKEVYAEVDRIRAAN